MNMYEWVETILFFVVLLALVKPLGAFMAKVYQGERTFLSPVFVPCENLLYRICGVKQDEEMDWKRYAGAMLLFNLVLFVALFVMLMVQHLLPLNPQKFPSIEVLRRLKPRISAMTTAMPVAAETKLCTASPTIWVK